jgi:hypothetical protein
MLCPLSCLRLHTPATSQHLPRLVSLALAQRKAEISHCLSWHFAIQKHTLLPHVDHRARGHNASCVFVYNDSVHL